MLLAADEAELAGVLGHELGHVVARHSAEQLAARWGLQVLKEVALGEDPEVLADIFADFTAAGGMAGYSRAHEREADDLGLRYITAAGYDPHGIVRMFQRMQSLERGLVPPPGRIPGHPSGHGRAHRAAPGADRADRRRSAAAAAGGALPGDDGLPAPVRGCPSP